MNQRQVRMAAKMWLDEAISNGNEEAAAMAREIMGPDMDPLGDITDTHSVRSRMRDAEQNSYALLGRHRVQTSKAMGRRVSTRRHWEKVRLGEAHTDSRDW